MNLSDKDLLNDWLTAEKGLVKTYGDYITEASNDKIRNTLKACFETAADSQFNVFCKMSSKGMYPLEVCEAQKITKAKQEYDGIKKELDTCK